MRWNGERVEPVETYRIRSKNKTKGLKNLHLTQGPLTSSIQGLNVWPPDFRNILFCPFLHLALQVLEASCHEASLVMWGTDGSSLAKPRSSKKFLLAFGWALKVSHVSCAFDTASPSRLPPIQMDPHSSFQTSLYLVCPRAYPSTRGWFALGWILPLALASQSSSPLTHVLGWGTLAFDYVPLGVMFPRSSKVCDLCDNMAGASLAGVSAVVVSLHYVDL